MDYTGLGMGGFANPMQPQMDRLSMLQGAQQQFQQPNFQQFQQPNFQQPMQQPGMQPNMQPNMNMQQQMPPVQQQPQSLSPQIIFVGSIEEVRTYPPDWSGNTSYFVDRTNGCMYTKQISLEDGLPKIRTYREVAEKQKEYVTKEEFEAWKQTLAMPANAKGDEKDE